RAIEGTYRIGDALAHLGEGSAVRSGERLETLSLDGLPGRRAARLGPAVLYPAHGPDRVERRLLAGHGVERAHFDLHTIVDFSAKRARVERYARRTEDLPEILRDDARDTVLNRRRPAAVFIDRHLIRAGGDDDLRAVDGCGDRDRPDHDRDHERRLARGCSGA